MRLFLLALMLLSLIMSAALPMAFGAGGLVVAGTYATIQVGRAIFMTLAVRGQALQRTSERFLVWCTLSSCLWLLGAGHDA